MANTSSQLGQSYDAIAAAVEPFTLALEGLEEEAESFDPESGRGGRAYPPARLRAESEQLRSEIDAAERRLGDLLEQATRFAKFFDPELL